MPNAVWRPAVVLGGTISRPVSAEVRLGAQWTLAIGGQNLTDEYADLSNEADFAAYVKQVQKAALYDAGVNAQYGEQLLTLSTCSYHTDEGRFVVVAKKQE